ncbi:MAG: hypothetical protein WBH16_00115 [Candidatus Nanopelagicales bacterium]
MNGAHGVLGPLHAVLADKDREPRRDRERPFSDLAVADDEPCRYAGIVFGVVAREWASVSSEW